MSAELERIKEGINRDLCYIHIDRGDEQWRRIVLVLIERIEALEREVVNLNPGVLFP